VVAAIVVVIVVVVVVVVMTAVVDEGAGNFVAVLGHSFLMEAQGPVGKSSSLPP